MNEPRSTRYQRLRRQAAAAGWCLAGLTLAILVVTPAARVLRDAAWRFASGLSGASRVGVALLFFLVVVFVLWDLAALPAMVYIALRVDGVYGRTDGNLEDVLLAQMRATLLALPAVLLAGAAILAAVRIAGTYWWLAAGLLIASLAAAIVRGGPLLFAGLATVRPLSKPGLADRLRRLAERVRVPVAGIDEWMVGDGSVTALVIGVGRGRRVLVASDVVRTWSDEEIEVVVAHELAHHAHYDLSRAVALDLVIVNAALYVADVLVSRAGALLGVTGPGDLAALPLIAASVMVVWAIATPLRHAQSRRQERRADVFAISRTGRAEAFGAAVRRLSAKHLADERPTALIRWLYHRHPPVADRLALAEAYRRRTPSAS